MVTKKSRQEIGQEKLDSYVEASFVIARAALAGTAVFCVVAALRCGTADVLKNALGATINAIAFLHYCNIDALKTSQDEDSLFNIKINGIRLADWSATLPLLVLEVHLFMDSSLEEASHGSGMSAAMVICGACGEYFKIFNPCIAVIFFLVAFACLGYVWYNFTRFLFLSPAESAIVFTFAAPWLLYGIIFVWPRNKWALLEGFNVFGMNNNIKHVLYNILDVHSKAVFALTLAIRTLN